MGLGIYQGSDTTSTLEAMITGRDAFGDVASVRTSENSEYINGYSNYSLEAVSEVAVPDFALTANVTTQADLSATLELQADTGEDPKAQVLVTVEIGSPGDGTLTASAGNLTDSGEDQAQYLAHFGDVIPLRLSTHLSDSLPTPPDKPLIEDAVVSVSIAQAPEQIRLQYRINSTPSAPTQEATARAASVSS